VQKVKVEYLWRGVRWVQFAQPGAPGPGEGGPPKPHRVLVPFAPR
jgi:hypothetical protein